MRDLCSMDTIQIEITNYCPKDCGNCTRFCQLVKKPYMMPLKQVKRAIDSMVGYPHMTGIMGGESLCHPDFDKICKYLQKKIPIEQCGLWTALPPGKEHHAQVICDTFKHVFLNDHSRGDIAHQAPLVGAREIWTNEKEMWLRIWGCWAQMSWSASINPRGAWFCEIAASMAMLFEEGEGWPVEAEWWTRTPLDFTEQAHRFCPRCGFAARTDLRCSLEPFDDVSPLNYEALKDKVRHPERLKLYEPKETEKCQPEMAAYKDTHYRNRIAARYGLRLYVNDQRFWSPVMSKDRYIGVPEHSMMEDLAKQYGGAK